MQAPWRWELLVREQWRPPEGSGVLTSFGLKNAVCGSAITGAAGRDKRENHTSGQAFDGCPSRCSDAWADLWIDSVLLSAADAVLAGRPSSFLLMPRAMVLRQGKVWCDSWPWGSDWVDVPPRNVRMPNGRGVKRVESFPPSANCYDDPMQYSRREAFTLR